MRQRGETRKAPNLLLGEEGIEVEQEQEQEQERTT